MKQQYTFYLYLFIIQVIIKVEVNLFAVTLDLIYKKLQKMIDS